jgi:hypothetical protein
MNVHVSRLVLAAAFALASAGSGCAVGGPAVAPSLGSNVIKLDEVERSTATNAYDLVSQARPNWLRGRGAPNLRGAPEVLPVVYIGTTRQGSAETLRAISIQGIQELRYINATSATTRYGEGHGGGVIEVVIRRRQEEGDDAS